jgi:nucleoside-diphosphate-sugar epimerase
MTVALVTGGSGYFGSALVARLVERGDSVRVLDLNDAHDRPAAVEFVQGDIRDPRAVADAVAGCDVIYHNVAQVPLANDAHLLRSVNVDGTRILLEQAADANVGKVVHTSSSAVFGVPDVNPVLPTTVPKPEEAYGHAKLAAEWACLAAVAGEFGAPLDVSIVRPRTILGHGRLGIFGILFDWIADGHDPLVLGNGSNRYQFVHADDLAAACVAAGERAGPGVFNIGAAEFGTMYETLSALCAHAGTGARVRRAPVGPTALAMRATAKLGISPFAPYHWLMYARSMWFDIDHARVQLGWEPQWTTAAMFAQSYDWFVQNRATADAAGASHHRRSAKQGVLTIAKHVTRVLPPAGAGR